MMERKRFFCWTCEKRVDCSLPEFVCSECKGEFIEEREGNEENETLNSNTQQNFRNHNQSNNEQVFSFTQNGNEGNISNFFESLLNFTPRPTNNSENQETRNNEGEFIPIGTDGLSSMIRSILGGNFVSSGSRNERGFSLGDYVFGDNMDDIISQMMDSYQSKGTPPASEKDINELKQVIFREKGKELTKEEEKYFEANKECVVCMEEFKENDKLSCLPCKHLFHPECVAKWLRMHDSCPVCRKHISKSSEKKEEKE